MGPGCLNTAVIYASINLKLPHPTPQATPKSFELLKIGSFKFPSRLAKTVFKCPTKCRI